MLRAMVLVLSLVATLAHAQPRESMRQFLAETSTPAAKLVAALRQRLPETVPIIADADGIAVHYAGNATPAPLANLFAAHFEQLDPKIIAAGQTVSLTLLVSDIGDGTEMSLMVMARFPEPTLPLPKDAVVMLNGTGPSDCEGQLVLNHPLPIDEAAPVFREHLEDQGFAFPDAEPQETSFFIGHRPGCDLALYLQKDRGMSLVVIRYLED